jgi:hypothetical protein
LAVDGPPRDHDDRNGNTQNETDPTLAGNRIVWANGCSSGRRRCFRSPTRAANYDDCPVSTPPRPLQHRLAGSPVTLDRVWATAGLA